MSNEIINPATVTSLTPEEIQAQIDQLNALKSNMENGTQEGVSTPSLDEAEQDISDTTSPEQQEIRESDAQTSNDVPPSPDTQEEFSNGVIDPAKKQELEEKFRSLINNPRYWENPNRVKRLEEVLVLPVYDDRSLQQFYNSAREELIKEELKNAIKENRPPVLPTEEQIIELAEKKHHDKITKLAKKEAKKKKAE